MNESLVSIISSLIKQKKEGSYWDFKQEWHKNNSDLVRDILSLANNIEYKGDRYIIIGVTDSPECTVKGFEKNDSRKKQSDLLDTVSKLSFSGGICPDLKIETIVIENQELDIIIIKDKPFKPYCLQKQYKDQKEIVYAGTVYTRVGDKNTAKDSTADLYNTEKMWRERFGLDRTPLERMQQYLLDVKGWQSDGVSISYYKQSPEFTLHYDLDSIKCEDRWWSSFLDKQTTKSKIVFKYHTTILKEVATCYFPCECITIPYPDVDYIKINNSPYPTARDTYCLFNYLVDSFDFSVLFYLYGQYKISPDLILQREAISAPSNPPIKHLPFIVFKSTHEKEHFKDFLHQNMKYFFSEKNISPTSEFGALKLEEEELFAYWAYDKYHDCNFDLSYIDDNGSIPKLMSGEVRVKV